MLIEIFNFLHFVGLAFGLGGATLAAIISRNAEKDADIGKAFMEIIPSISKLIWLGLILLVISGIGISFYVKWPLNSQLLIIKHILVFWIVVFGVVIGVKAGKLKNLAPAKINEKPAVKFIKLQKLKVSDSYQKQEFLKARKQMKIFSIINLVLWYAVTLMSVFV